MAPEADSGVLVPFDLPPDVQLEVTELLNRAEMLAFGNRRFEGSSDDRTIHYPESSLVALPAS